MSILSLQNVSAGFGLAPVLDSASLNIEAGERIAVTGRNGEGKSTLLKIIAGIAAPDSGEIIAKPGLKTVYLPQEARWQGGDFAACEPHLLSNYLSQLGVPEGAPFESLSGGQRRRAMLARRLAEEPDLLLLDEPTNHMDTSAIEWLEDFLSRAALTCLFVTHDRAFLRRAAKRILDIDRGRVIGWDCDYAAFLQRKAQVLADNAAAWERKGKLLAREEEWIRRGVKARTTRNEGRVEALRKLRSEFAGRRAEIGSSRLEAGAVEASGQSVVKFKDVCFSWTRAANAGAANADAAGADARGPDEIISHFNATILRGEKIGIIGANGAGKTTLIKLITGEIAPTSGEIKVGARVQIAAADQMRGELDLEKTVAENIADDNEYVTVNGARRHIYSYLQDFLFTPDRARTPVKALSGGERARVGLARLFLNLGNLLILDEPTNDLDIETLELLEEQLLAYNGTLLLVSHDREFMDNVVTSSFVLPGAGEIAFCPGGYSEWKVMDARRRAAATAAAETTRKPPRPADNAADSSTNAEPARASGRLGYMEKRELDALPGKIEKIETELTELHALLSDGFIFSTAPEKAAQATLRLQALEPELERLVERWAELEARAN